MPLTVTRPFASGICRGRRIKPSATLNMAVLAPTPIAIDSTATSENPGVLRQHPSPVTYVLPDGFEHQSNAFCYAEHGPFVRRFHN